MTQPLPIDDITSPESVGQPNRRRAPKTSGLVDWSTLWDRATLGPNWAINPLIPGGGRSTIIYSPKGVGKSELLLYVAVMAALGRPVLLSPAGQPMRVLYIDNEMTEDDLVDRLDQFGVGPTDDLSALSYYLLPDLPYLNTAEGGAAVLELVDYHQAELVVIDTITRSVAGHENDAEPIKELGHHLIRHLKRLGVPSVWAGHTGKTVSKGQRGSSEYGGIDDLVLLMAREKGEAVRLRADKTRSTWMPQSLELIRKADAFGRIAWSTPSTGWPLAVVSLASLLDSLEAPLDISRRAAEALLRESGHAVRASTVGDALRCRREPGPGTTRPAEVGTTEGNHRADAA